MDRYYNDSDKKDKLFSEKIFGSVGINYSSKEALEDILERRFNNYRISNINLNDYGAFFITPDYKENCKNGCNNTFNINNKGDIITLTELDTLLIEICPSGLYLTSKELKRNPGYSKSILKDSKDQHYLQSLSLFFLSLYYFISGYILKISKSSLSVTYNNPKKIYINLNVHFGKSEEEIFRKIKENNNKNDQESFYELKDFIKNYNTKKVKFMTTFIMEKNEEDLYIKSLYKYRTDQELKEYKGYRNKFKLESYKEKKHFTCYKNQFKINIKDVKNIIEKVIEEYIRKRKFREIVDMYKSNKFDIKATIDHL